MRGKRIEVVHFAGEFLQAKYLGLLSTIATRTGAGLFAVTDDQILKIVIEPGSAVPLAVTLYNKDFGHMIEKKCVGTR